MHPPILQFDPTQEAIIDPTMLHIVGRVPERVVMCFFRECISSIVEETGAELTAHLHCEIGPSPVYTVPWNGTQIGLAQPGVGAPLCAASLEELIAMGGAKFMACGSAGVLIPGVPLGEVLLPSAAVRDEGTSYHYLHPDAPALPSARLLDHARRWLVHHEVAHREVTTWTTDAVYRETRVRMELRMQQGCEAVDMEAAAFFAVAQFRGVDLAQLFYASDDLSGTQWDSRNFLKREDARQRLLRLTLDIAAALP